MLMNAWMTGIFATMEPAVTLRDLTHVHVMRGSDFLWQAMSVLVSLDTQIPKHLHIT